jgi:chromosome segregation ATPase
MSSQKSHKSLSQSNNECQQQIREFYANTKEKLLKLKDEIQKSQSEYEAQKVIVEKKTLLYNETQEENKKLELLLQGWNERVIQANKIKITLQQNIQRRKNLIDKGTQDLDNLKIDVDHKVNNIKNNAEWINQVKKNFIQAIQEKINKEKELNKALKDRITETTSKIEEIKQDLLLNDVNEGKRKKALLDEAAEMTKFLAEI